MVKLRLKRMGRKRRPFYRIVAMTDNQPRNGRALQELGTYDPVHARFDVNEEAAITWLNDGAQMTPTVHDLFHNKGVLARWRGFEGSDNEAALKKDKPKRRKKLGATVAAPATETTQETPATEETPAAEAVEATEVAAEAPEVVTEAEPTAEKEAGSES